MWPSQTRFFSQCHNIESGAQEAANNLGLCSSLIFCKFPRHFVRGCSPATLIQIYKQWDRPIFYYGSLSTNHFGLYHQQNSAAPKQVYSACPPFTKIRLALRLPKYICPRLLHDSSGLPYVKDRLLSCASKSLDRIAQNPLAEGRYLFFYIFLLKIKDTFSR